MQQQSAATTPTGTDLRRPGKASELRERPSLTAVRLVCIQNIGGSTAAAANGNNRIARRVHHRQALAS